ncbi:MAG: hypothetical protein U5J83_12225 [Bryobacterales bacterium]|nr:hypothetical protein [Bryobacterales bacterium]
MVASNDSLDYGGVGNTAAPATARLPSTTAQNTSTATRTGTLTIAGQTFTVQQAAAACTYSLSGTSVSLGSAGGATATNVIAASGCSWTETLNAPWTYGECGNQRACNGAVRHLRSPEHQHRYSDGHL